MNAPSRYELFVLGDGEKKVLISEDPSTPNSVTLTIRKEDHTIGNALRQQLLLTPNVIFAGYKIPHPLEPQVVIKVQTDGITSPIQAVQSAIRELLVTLDKTKKFYDDEVIKYRAVQLESDTFAAAPATRYVEEAKPADEPVDDDDDEYAF